jgi:hypothetical protein
LVTVRSTNGPHQARTTESKNGAQKHLAGTPAACDSGAKFASPNIDSGAFNAWIRCRRASDSRRCSTRIRVDRRAKIARPMHRCSVEPDAIQRAISCRRRTDSDRYTLKLLQRKRAREGKLWHPSSVSRTVRRLDEAAKEEAA